MFKYFKENGSENTFKYIESYNPEKRNDDFKKKYSIGTFNVNKNVEEITLQVSETNMNIDEVVELKNYYNFKDEYNIYSTKSPPIKEITSIIFAPFSYLSLISISLSDFFNSSSVIPANKL